MCIFINMTLSLIVEWVVYRIWSFEVHDGTDIRFTTVLFEVVNSVCALPLK